MKRLFATILVILLSVSMLGGCLGTKSISDLMQTEPADDVSLAGKYVLTYWEDEEGDYLEYLVSVGVRASDIFIELKEDGTYIWDMSAADEFVDKGTYKVSGNTLTLSYSGGKDILEIDGNYIYYEESSDLLVFEKKGGGRSSSGSGATPAFSFTEVLNAATPVTAEQLLKYYDLNDDERLLFKQLTEGIASFELRVGVDHAMNSDAAIDSFEKVMSVVFLTYPEVFWWGKNILYIRDLGPADDGYYSILPIYYVAGKNFSAQFDNRGNVIYPSDDEIAAARSWVESEKAAMRERLNDIPVHTGMTPYELEVAVYEWLRDNVRYERSSDKDKMLGFKNAYGAIVTGRADCVGYSSAFAYITSLLGFECVIETGLLFDGSGVTDSGGGHAWNFIKLGGDWYNADVTCDAFFSEVDGLPSHRFLNRTDQFFADNFYKLGEYPPDSFQAETDISCTATQYNYFVMTDAYIASDADFQSKVPVRIELARANGEIGFDMELDPSYSKAFDFDANCERVASESGVSTDDLVTYFHREKYTFFIMFK